MNRLRIYQLLRRNAKLNEKRHPALEQNKVAKVLMWIGAVVMFAYLVFIGTAFGRLAVETDMPSVLLVFMTALLIIDFLFRFMAQQTPLVFIKPYLLIPIPAMSVVESYLLTLLSNGYNFLWLGMFLPYAVITIAGGYSVWTILAVVVCGLLMVMINSQWYLLVRSLIYRTLLWWLLPVAVYAALIVPLVLCNDPVGELQDIADSFYDAPVLWLLSLLLLAVLVGLLFVNRNLQFRFIYNELSREQKKAPTIKHVSQFAFLEHYGQTGEYLKLELKSIMRNKAIRARAYMSLGLIIVFSVICAYTDIYDGEYLLNFWCYYCFSIYGMTALTKVMGPEGNYIDLLMTQHENILQLLRAKYIFHVVILLVPMLIMLPAIINGKFTLLMTLAYMFLTSGLGYLIMFQLAVYNKQTLPLDSKVAGKNGVESGIQLAIELLGMFLPLVIVGVMLVLLDKQIAYIVVALLGLVLTALHPLWLRNVYNRMMARKYTNLEGFHASR